MRKRKNLYSITGQFKNSNLKAKFSVMSILTSIIINYLLDWMFGWKNSSVKFQIKI